MWKPVSTRNGLTTDLINRQTACRFSGNELRLDLSLGLFSSAGVDTGSMLLLKTVGKSIDLDSLSNVLDVGCGVGTLGLAVAKRCPEATVMLVDRDELAVQFTQHNADLNKLKNIEACSRLMLEGPHRQKFNLILSNFPAKAGEPVLTDYLRKSLSLLDIDGTAAIVIVYTLADLCRDLIIDAGGKITLEDSSKQHTVFHYQPDAGSAESTAASEDNSDILKPYIRHHGEFKVKRSQYELDTVWNISDFDSLSWRLKLMGEMINLEPRQGNWIFWAPGQGHLPLMVGRHRGARPERITLCGRDRLELLISARNLKTNGIEIPVELKSLADPGSDGGFGKPESADLLVSDIAPIPRSNWTDTLKISAHEVLKPGGIWAVIGRSADIALLTKATRGWTPLKDRRNHGWRGIIFRKN